MSPAKVISVDIDEKNKKARVTVEESQAPLAIGKNGINVNLAARLTGYDLDIMQAASEKAPEKVTEEVSKEEEQEPENSETISS